MLTLEQKYNIIVADSNNWSYYENPNLCIADTWEDTDKSFDFIVKYFYGSGKNEVFKDSVLCDYNNQIRERAPHIISTYLLGIEIAESFGIDTKERNEDNINFLYLWFMTCLYHDVGYRMRRIISAIMSELYRGAASAH